MAGLRALAGHPRRATHVEDPDAPFMRKVGWQLAALTVGLLCALLLVLGGAVYLTTDQLLRDSLQHTLKDRAAHPPEFLLHAIQTDSLLPPIGSIAPPDQPREFPPDPSGVFYTALDTRLTVLGATGPYSPPVSDSAQARVALRDGAACCDLVTSNGKAYLVYSQAWGMRGGPLLGVVQTSISAEQYQSSLQSLLHVLLTVVTLGLAAAAVISAVLVRRSLRPIQRALRRQRDFVADAAHELRTPLTIMRTAGEFGLAHETVTEQQRAVEQMLEQNVHLSRLVDSLSLLARADSGVVQIERQSLDLGQLVREVASGVAVLAEERNVSLHIETASESKIQGDSGRLRQLLLILLDNAIKYTPEGGTIRVGVDRASGAIRLRVQDSGPGIAPRDLPHLFERFYRADHARAGEGTGLGLAIGQWIVEAHGGRIVAANSAPHGALFTVSFPAAG